MKEHSVEKLAGDDYQGNCITLLRLIALKLLERILLILLQSSPRLLNNPRALEADGFLSKSGLRYKTKSNPRKIQALQQKSTD